MSEEESLGKNAAKGAGGFLAMLATEVGRGLLQFVILGVILLVAFWLFFANAWLGMGFGAIGFIVWSVKTGWTFW
jgi:hypothetical protein